MSKWIRRAFYDLESGKVLSSYVMSGNLKIATPDIEAERKGFTNYGVLNWTTKNETVEAAFAKTDYNYLFVAMQDEQIDTAIKVDDVDGKVTNVIDVINTDGNPVRLAFAYMEYEELVTYEELLEYYTATKEALEE